MLLAIRPLQDVSSANAYRPTTSWSFTEGDAADLYFQIVDGSLDLMTEGFSPPGRRYMPAVGATMSVRLASVDMAKDLVRACTQPFSLDPSIWKLQVLATDKIRGTAAMTVTLTEGSRVTHGSLQPACCVRSASLVR